MSVSKEDSIGGKTVLVAGKVSNYTYARIESFRDIRNLTRSQVVADAVDFYLNTKECILCGALNNPDGKTCSVCGAKLYSEREIEARVAFGLDTFSRNSKEFKELLSQFPAADQPFISKFIASGYFPSIELKINRVGGEREYLLRLTFIKDELSVTPSGKDITIMIPSENIYAFVNSLGDLIYSSVDAGKMGIEWDFTKLRRADSEALKKLLYGESAGAVPGS